MARPHSRAQAKQELGVLLGWLGSAVLHVLALLLVALACRAVGFKARQDEHSIPAEAFMQPGVAPGEDLWAYTPRPLATPHGSWVSNGASNVIQWPAEPHDDLPKGRDEAIADSEMGGEGAFMMTAVGGLAAGMFGISPQRITERLDLRPRAFVVDCALRRELLLNAAIGWLCRTQRDDGWWSADGNRSTSERDPLATSLAAWFLLRCVHDTIGPCPRARHALERATTALCAGRGDTPFLAAWPTHAIAAAVVTAVAEDKTIDPRVRAVAGATVPSALALIDAYRRGATGTGKAGAPDGWGAADDAGIDAWTTAWSCIALAQMSARDADADAVVRDGVGAWLDAAVRMPASVWRDETASLPLRWPVDSPTPRGADAAGFGVLAAIHVGVPMTQRGLRALIADMDDSAPTMLLTSDPALRWSRAVVARCRQSWRWPLDREVLFQRLLGDQRPDGGWEAQPGCVPTGGRVGATALNGLTALAIESDLLPIRFGWRDARAADSGSDVDAPADAKPSQPSPAR